MLVKPKKLNSLKYDLEQRDPGKIGLGVWDWGRKVRFDESDGFHCLSVDGLLSCLDSDYLSH